MSVLERAGKDLAEKNLWKARDRLQGALVAREYDERVYDMLGRVYFEMGDLPAAGAVWYVTSRQGADVEASIRALDNRFGSRAIMKVKAMHLRFDVDAYPETAQARLRELLGQAEAAGYKHRARALRSGDVQWAIEDVSRTDVGEALGAITVCIVTLGVWAVGFVTLLVLLYNAITNG